MSKCPEWVDGILNGKMYEFGPNGRKRVKKGKAEYVAWVKKGKVYKLIKVKSA